MQKNNKYSLVKKIHADEQGFVLVITMMILVILTIIGMAALDSSTFEVKIASNDRWSKVAFNLADGSVYSSSKLITEAIRAAADPSHGTVAFTGFNIEKDDDSTVAAPHAADDFYKVVMGYVETKPERQKVGDAPFSGANFDDPATNSGAVFVPDFVITPSGSGPEMVAVTITGRKATMIAGGGAEFGAGAAGAGAGAGGGGAAVVFDVDMDGFAGNNSRSSISARYRMVLGTSGGL